MPTDATCKKYPGTDEAAVAHTDEVEDLRSTLTENDLRRYVENDDMGTTDKVRCE